MAAFWWRRVCGWQDRERAKAFADDVLAKTEVDLTVLREFRVEFGTSVSRLHWTCFLVSSSDNNSRSLIVNDGSLSLPWSYFIRVHEKRF